MVSLKPLLPTFALPISRLLWLWKVLAKKLVAKSLKLAVRCHRHVGDSKLLLSGRHMLLGHMPFLLLMHVDFEVKAHSSVLRPVTAFESIYLALEVL